MEEKRNSYKTLLENLKGRHNLRDLAVDGDHIKIDLKRQGYEDMNRINATQGRIWRWVLVNTVMNLQVPFKVGNFLTS
jgi:hypothetical protein